MGDVPDQGSFCFGVSFANLLPMLSIRNKTALLKLIVNGSFANSNFTSD